MSTSRDYTSQHSSRVVQWVALVLGLLSLLLGLGLAYMVHWIWADRLQSVVEYPLEDGSIYTGDLRRGLPDGYGDAAYPDGRTYLGFWKQGTFNGRGTLACPDGISYQGHWLEGRLQDATVHADDFTYVGGLKFLSDSVRLVPDGFGRMVYKLSGDVYIGNWRDGCKHGLGRLLHPEGNYRYGRWKNGELEVPKGKEFFDGDHVYGIDISHHQKHISWDIVTLYATAQGKVYSGKAKAYTYPVPVDFVYMKATEGASHKDTKYADYVERARAHYIPKGAYHFFRENVSAKAQMENFCSVAVFDRGDMPPVLDVELSPEAAERFGKARLLDSVKVCLKIMEDHFGVKPLVYTGNRMRNSYLGDDDLPGYDFWTARYSSEQPDNFPFKIWQFTQKGQLSGLRREYDVDIDRFEGNYKQFRSFLQKNQRYKY